MKPKFVAILEECIERGINSAIENFDHVVPYPTNLEEKIEQEIWFQLDQFFDFETEII